MEKNKVNINIFRGEVFNFQVDGFFIHYNKETDIICLNKVNDDKILNTYFDLEEKSPYDNPYGQECYVWCVRCTMLPINNLIDMEIPKCPASYNNFILIDSFLSWLAKPINSNITHEVYSRIIEEVISSFNWSPEINFITCRKAKMK